MAAIWGDADKGAHATFTKFVPGFDAGVHPPTNDVWIVVVTLSGNHSRPLTC
jgi:hypothetical protein